MDAQGYAQGIDGMFRAIGCLIVTLLLGIVFSVGGCVYMRAHFQADLKRLREANANECTYRCRKCGWTPRDDGPMNSKDTCEPLVAATRIDAHECSPR